MNHEQEIPKLLRFDDLKALFKISRSSLARWEQKNQFPKRVKIGDNSIGWRADEVKQWLADRVNFEGVLNDEQTT